MRLAASFHPLSVADRPRRAVRAGGAGHRRRPGHRAGLAVRRRCISATSGPAVTGGRIHDCRSTRRIPPFSTSRAAARRHLEVDEQGRHLERHFRQAAGQHLRRARDLPRRHAASSGPAPASRTIGRARPGAAACIDRPTPARRGPTLACTTRDRSAASCSIRRSQHRLHRGGWKPVGRQSRARRVQDDRRRPHVEQGAVRRRVHRRDGPRDGSTQSAVLYAATYQRMRKACGFNGGGPGSAIYKTTDAGATWTKLENGIPPGDKGRIGLAIAMSKPDVLDRDDRARQRRRHLSHGRRRRDVEAHERHQSAPDVLQQADDRSEQRQARVAARHVTSSRAKTAAPRSPKNRRRRRTTSA